MSRRHHRRSGGVVDTGWGGISAGRGRCALYFHNPQSNEPGAESYITLHGRNIPPAYARTFEYSTDGVTWNTWGTINNTNTYLSYTLTGGNYLYIRNSSPTPTPLSIYSAGTGGDDVMRYYNFEVEHELGTILGGDIRSMLCRNYDAASWTGWSMVPYTFYSLFAEDTHDQNRITLAQWSKGIYFTNTINDIRFDLFENTTPVASHCYDSMFAGIYCSIPPEPRCKPSAGENNPLLETGALVLPKYHAAGCCMLMFANSTLNFGSSAAPMYVGAGGNTGYTTGTDCYRIITMPPGTITATNSMTQMFAGSNVYYSPIDDTIYGFGSGYVNNQAVPNHLATQCYNYMFVNCVYLRQAPILWHNNSLANYCYQSMFEGCTNLVYPPELKATTLATGCYQGMFKNCTSLEQAPELPATTLVSNCYREMFYGCSKLKYVNAKFTTTPGNSYTYNWLYGVFNSNMLSSMGGVFVKNSSASWSTTGASGVPTGWRWKVVKLEGLIFHSTTASNNWSMSFEASNSSVAKTVYYSIDGQTWNSYNTGTHPAITPINGYVIWKSGSSQAFGNANYYNSFQLTHDCYCFGNISAMANSNLSALQYQFRQLFDSATILTAPTLDMTTISIFSYADMFLNCRSLKYASYMPIVSPVNSGGAERAFVEMYSGCIGLTHYPIIKYQNAVWDQSIANRMFYNCTSLIHASPFMAMNASGYIFGRLSDGTFNECFRGCSALVEPPNLHFAGMGEVCMGGMFMDCSTLQYTPAIEINSFVSQIAVCDLELMFSNCANLSAITFYCNSSTGIDHTNAWVGGVSYSGAFYKSGSWTNVFGTSNIPSGWTVYQITRPNLNNPDW